MAHDTPIIGSGPSNLYANGSGSLCIRFDSDHDGVDRYRGAGSTSGRALDLKYCLYDYRRDLICYHYYGQPSIWSGRLPGIAPGRNGFMAFGISGQWIDNDLFYPISALAAADVHIR